jgi:glycosyltransferase involved in cell wall biosynthesis
MSRQGIVGLARRKLAHAAAKIAERATIVRFQDWEWQPDHRPVFLMVVHNCGGGTERHVNDLAALLLRDGIRPIRVRPGLNGRLIWEEKVPGGEIRWCRASGLDRRALRYFVDLTNPVHAHVHHLAGVPDALIEILREREVSFDWTIHDYHAICPRIHLIGVQGIYCGEPDPSACDGCLSRLGDDRGRAMNESITVWRERFRRHLSGARRVFAPSEDAARRIGRFMPGLRLTIRPHLEHLESPGTLAARLAPDEPVRVVVLGTIVSAKGSEKLLACARDAGSRRLALEFHVIGATDRDAQFARLKNVDVSGRYRESDVFERMAAARCHLAFLPTVCPESFMYTLSIVMAAGFYTVCYDLGAQAERVRAWGWGQVLPLDMEPHAVNNAILAAGRWVAAEPRSPRPPVPAAYPDALKSYYGFAAEELDDMRYRRSHGPAASLAAPHHSERKAHARFH